MVKSVLIVCIFVLLQDFIRCWVFTDINSQAIRQRSYDIDDDENDISPEDLTKEKLNLIYPGTKWCGAGSVAENFDDLGSSAESDTCCRDHDLCPDIILAGYTKYNLTNTSYYTKLSCACDEEFHRCLRAVNSKTSNTIGSLYFNALNTQCFRLDYPITGCKKYGGWLHKKCYEYEYDVNKKQKYQWFDVPKY